MDAFNRVNIWNLGHTAFDQKPDSSVALLSHHSIRGMHQLTQQSKHFFLHMKACQVHQLRERLPLDLDRSHKAAVREWYLAEQRTGGLQRLPLISERDMCDRYVRTLNNVVKAQALGLNDIRSLKLEISIHEPRWDREPQDQCGLTLYLHIKFGPTEASRPLLNEEDAVASTVQASAGLEPKRRLLLPLLAMQNIQSIHVRRTWTLNVAKKERIHAGDVVTEQVISTQTRSIAMALHFYYKSAEDLLLAAGKDLVNFRMKGIDEAGVGDDDEILAIDENTAPVMTAIFLQQKPIDWHSHCLLPVRGQMHLSA